MCLKFALNCFSRRRNLLSPDIDLIAIEGQSKKSMRMTTICSAVYSFFYSQLYKSIRNKRQQVELISPKHKLEMHFDKSGLQPFHAVTIADMLGAPSPVQSKPQEKKARGAKRRTQVYSHYQNKKAAK